MVQEWEIPTVDLELVAVVVSFCYYIVIISVDLSKVQVDHCHSSF